MPVTAHGFCETAYCLSTCSFPSSSERIEPRSAGYTNPGKRVCTVEKQEQKKETREKVCKGAAAGGLSGIINGFFGGGGGLILVPLLKRYVKVPCKEAHATCVAIAAMMSVVTAAVYLLRGAVTFADAGWYMAGGAAGGLLGGVLLGSVPKVWLRRIFGIFLVYSAVRIFVHG